MTITMESLTEANNPLGLQALFYLDGCKSHLDLGSNDGRTLRGLDKSTLTAVELFAPSVAVMRENGITAHCRDVRAFVQEMTDINIHYDRVTCFDVIEHLPRSDGEKLLDQVERLAFREVVFFVPIETPELCATERWRQHREEGLSQHPDAQRELHDHKSQWNSADFQRRGYITLVLENFHYEGFGAFFAAKYRDSADQAAVMAKVQAFANGAKPQTWGHMGKSSGVHQSLFLNGIDRAFIGDGVSIGYGARIETIRAYGGVEHSPTLVIGDNTTIEMFCHIGAAESVVIGRDCMLAGRVTVSDHDHGLDPDKPLHYQPLTVAPVRIGDSVFVGENAVICKGVTVGDKAVIGAGSVVTKDVAPGAVVGGVPAREIQLNTITLYHPLVRIIIPTIDPKSKRLKACLDSLGHAEGSIVVDVIVDAKRTGFAATVNRGIVKAMADKPDYLLIVNDDTVVYPGAIERMLAVMQHFPEVGLVGPVSNFVSGPQQREPLSGPISEETNRLVGFCLLIKRAVIDKIGALDPAYPAGFEDDDYCLRAQSAGFRLRIALDSFVYHEGHATFKAANIDGAALQQAGWEVFSRKWNAELRPGGYMVQPVEWNPERCYVALNTQPVKAE